MKTTTAHALLAVCVIVTFAERNGVAIKYEIRKKKETKRKLTRRCYPLGARSQR